MVRPTNSPYLFVTLSDPRREALQASFTTKEIKKSISDCGSNKAPGLDGFLFSLFEKVLGDYEG